jgi:hypothetical protein
MLEMPHLAKHHRQGTPRQEAFSHSARRGTAAVALMVSLALMGLAIMAAVMSGSRDQSLSVSRVQGDRARLAAEAAARLAVTELLSGSDADGDGGIGTLSNDNNSATDTTINSGTRLWATRSDSGGVITITARGQNADAVRAIRVTAAEGSTVSAGDEVFFTRDSTAAVRRSAFNTATSTWGAATVSGTTSLAPIWIASAVLDDSSIVLTSNNGNGLYYGLANSSGTATYSSICSDIDSTITRPFDAATEPLSGEGVVAYYDKSASAMRYRTVISGTLSSAASMGMTTGAVKWADLVSMDSAGDEVMALTIDGNKHAIAARWTGSAWTGHTTLSTAIADETKFGLDAALELSSGCLLAVMSDSTSGRVGYRVYTPGSGWSALAYLTGFGGKVLWVRLASVPGGDEVFLTAMNENKAVYAARWSGSAWNTPASIVSDTGSTNNRRFDVAVSPDGSDIMAMYFKGTGTVYYRLWNGSAWTAEATAFTLSTGNAEVVLSGPGLSDGRIVGAIGDSSGGVNVWSWSGTAFGTVSRVGTTTSSYAAYEWFTMPEAAESTSAPTITSWSSVAP